MTTNDKTALNPKCPHCGEFMDRLWICSDPANGLVVASSHGEYLEVNPHDLMDAEPEPIRFSFPCTECGKTVDVRVPIKAEYT